MFNKSETNTTTISGCSVSGLIAVKDIKGKTHIIQRELISHTEEEEIGWFYSDKKTPTTLIKYTSGKWVRVALTGEELAQALDISIIAPHGSQ
ncbi:cobalamin biosynthesis protein CbiX [Salmonella enterica]|nr:cobalamin biosynthesis protein CbiX [Salmonella enterica]